MIATNWLRGKRLALGTLATQAKYFRNWPQVFRAYRDRQVLPPLKLRSGATLYHSNRDDSWSLFREIFVDGCYTRKGFYSPRPSDVVIDCGANIGFFTLYLQSVAPGIRVHCFEPSESTRSRLLNNIEKNGLAGDVRVHGAAILDRSGEIKLMQTASAGDATIVATHGEPLGYERAPCMTLDEALTLCESPDIDLLKIDVEGAEVEIIRGASAAAWSRIRRVVLEYHEGIRPGCREQVREILSRHYSHVSYHPLVPSGDLGIMEASRDGH